MTTFLVGLYIFLIHIIINVYCDDVCELTSKDHERLAQEFNRDGFVILRQHFDVNILNEWKSHFDPLLTNYINYLNESNKESNRGPSRYYITLPFKSPFNDPKIYYDNDILKILNIVIGNDIIMSQLATDTPLNGSIYQDIHRDCSPLFPELNTETPSFQIAVNFPLVNVTELNGPFEVLRGTHILSRNEGLNKYNNGEIKLEKILMNVGDVMIRDVRGLHRGTPNKSNKSRPMVVIGYSRKWLYRSEVKIDIPRNEYDKLTTNQKYLLRSNPIVDEININPHESYTKFAYDDKGKIVDA